MPSAETPATNKTRAGALPFAVRALDVFSEVILVGMILFAPWAFGTTQPWSVRVMNFAGYALGMLLAAKWMVRWKMGVRIHSSAAARKLVIALSAFTIAILAWCLLSAINAQFTYVATEYRADPHPHVKWLPHSLDRLASWRVFWNWLALACVFWAVRDWLITDIANGRRSTRRLRRMIFFLAANGALVALEGVFQRLSGTAKLLWIQPTHDNAFASAQFGPYAYRSNAAQFFNLLWPPALGLWWHLHMRATAGERRAGQKHHWLLLGILMLVVAPLISLSRGGLAVTMLQMCACGVLLFFAARFSTGARIGILLMFALAIAGALFLAGDSALSRFADSTGNPLSGREETYRLAARMTKDYPWFGVGPGAYDSVFQLYRNSPDDYWPAQLHNDWLEYRITFGWLGCALLLAAGTLVLMRWFVPGGLRSHWMLASGLWIALGGCLLHARFDFPLQIYSIQFVFVLWCAVLFSLSRAREG